MKKIILSAATLAVAAVASVSVAPTTSEAIPAFARQTGAACLSCHFQSFPTLNAYGRSFKMSGLTDTSQEVVEDEALSMPVNLNWTVMVRPQFNATTVDTAGTSTTTHEFNSSPADAVFMIGGRAGENTGTFIEYDGAYANWQMFNAWDMGDYKVGSTFFKAGFGEDAGMQLMNVWGQHGGMIGGKGLSINQAMSKAGGDTAGVNIWAGNDMGAVQVAFVNPEATTSDSWKLATAVRGVGFMEFGDFELGAGIIAVTGSYGAAKTDAKRFGIDFQAMGDIGHMQVGVFADFASAGKSSTTATNIYNASTTDDRSGYSFRATLKPLHNVIFLAGLGQDTTGTATTDKTLIGVEYEFQQNFVITWTMGTEDDGTTKTTASGLDFELLI